MSEIYYIKLYMLISSKCSKLAFNQRLTVLLEGVTYAGLYNTARQKFKKVQFSSYHKKLKLK